MKLEIINGRPYDEVFTSLFVRPPPSAHPSDHKKLLLTMSLSDARCRTWCSKHRTGLTHCIGTRSDVGCRTGAMSGEIFNGRLVRRSVGQRGVGQRRALSDGGRQTGGSFYFFLEPPLSHPSLSLINQFFWHRKVSVVYTFFCCCLCYSLPIEY